MLDSFTIRHYLPEQDVLPLSQMLTEIESIDPAGEETSEEFLRSMVEWPNFDPGQNVWIAELNGDFAGFGQILPRPASYTAMYVVVHPSQRRKGLGTRLLSLALDRARETACKKILIYAAGHNVGSNAFLLHHGFEVIGTSGVMVAPVTELPPVEIPSGYLIRDYPGLRNPALLTQALDQCYKGMVGHNQNVTSADRYLHYHGEEGIHLLGVCAGKPQGKSDESGISDLLDAPGLIKEYRQRGFQHFLTLAVMHWLRGKDTRPITLEYWGDDEQTVALYRGLGFEPVNEQIAYQRELE
jgi:ribosomal protein S18 acetylase RimI-like enzyme